MPVVIINEHEVAELLPMDECMAAMEKILADLARGECDLPLRQILWMPERIGALGLMPSYWDKEKIIGLKAVTFFPGNEGSELDSHQGAVLLYEAERGCLLAIVDGTSITAIRTAAVSGVATRLLARDDASRLALIGSGVQARTHLAAMIEARALKRVRVCSKTFENAQVFARQESKRHGIDIEAMRSVEEAVDGADIICTVTSSTEPVLRGEWLSEGAHINAVGSSVASSRELDAAAVKKSRLFVDRRESALNEAGDFLLAKQEGVVDDDHIVGEIGEILAGTLAGRGAAEEITLFKSVGLAVEDLASALHVYRQAKKQQRGSWTDLGGGRSEAH